MGTVDGKPVKRQFRFFRDLRNASINSLLLIVESQQESTAAMWISPCDQHQPAGVTALHRAAPVNYGRVQKFKRTRVQWLPEGLCCGEKHNLQSTLT